jgi:Ni/Fe-hydrogenase 1 B-type cytochrome subunit
MASTPVDDTPQGEPLVYVYEAPVRLWHWVNATAITLLFVTGYLIGSPPPSLNGEPSAHYLFGWIRFIHFSCGQIMAVGIIFASTGASSATISRARSSVRRSCRASSGKA